MFVSVKISLKEATAAKKRRLHALLSRIKSLTGKYIESLWNDSGKLDAETLNRIPCNYLSYRHRSNCLRVALETVVSTRKSLKALKKRGTVPNPPKTMWLSSLVCRIESGKGSFDYVLKISGLVPRKPIIIPFKSHKVLNRWLSVPGSKIKQGACINQDFAYICIEVPNTSVKQRGEVLAVDAGINKLLVDSENTHYGKECKKILNQVRRCKPGSKGKQKAIATRRYFMNRVVKQIPWNRISAIAYEDLKNIKKGKKPNRGKSFRKLVAPWTIRQVFSRIAFLAQLNRVRVVVVNPRDTSRKCPSCLMVSKENRKGERFRCISCQYEQDADEVGAHNILSKALETLGSLWYPSSQNLKVVLS